MNEKVGVVETKEVLIALMAIGKAMAKASKDGLDLGDLVALVGNEEVKAALALAAVNVSKVPAEIKDIDLAEGLELVVAMVKEVPALLESFKK